MKLSSIGNIVKNIQPTPYEKTPLKKQADDVSHQVNAKIDDQIKEIRLLSETASQMAKDANKNAKVSTILSVISILTSLISILISLK